MKNVADAIARLGWYRVLLQSAVQTNSALYRVIVGVTAVVNPKAVAIIALMEFGIGAVLEVPTGVLADRWGRVPVALLGKALAAAALVALFWALELNSYPTLSFGLLLMVGLLIGIGRPMISGSVEAFYQDAISRRQIVERGAAAETSFTVSNRHARFGTSISVIGAFLGVYLLYRTPWQNYLFLFGAALYVLASAKLYIDYRSLGDAVETGNRSAFGPLFHRMVRDRIARFALFLNFSAGVIVATVLSYLVVAVGRESFNSEGSFLILMVAFIMGFACLGWIVKASLLPYLIHRVPTRYYVSSLFGLLGIGSLFIMGSWSYLSFCPQAVLLAGYGILIQVVHSGIRDFSMNLIMTRFNRADFGVVGSAVNLPVYVATGAYNVYLIFLTPTGVPGVGELFLTTIGICLISILTAQIYYRESPAGARNWSRAASH
jgi:MFS family permease